MDTGKSGLGLDGNVAAALGYPIGIFAIIALIIDKENRFVKFHALQSLLLHVAFAVVGIVLVVVFAIVVIVIAAAAGAAGGGTAGRVLRHLRHDFVFDWTGVHSWVRHSADHFCGKCLFWSEVYAAGDWRLSG